MRYFKDFEDGSITYLAPDGFVAKKYWLIPKHTAGGNYQSNLPGIGKVLNRIDGPAEISYSRDGIFQETWWVNGIIHREIYPAILEKRKDSDELISYRYYSSGKEITTEVQEYLKENNIIDPLDIPFDHKLTMKLKFW